MIVKCFGITVPALLLSCSLSASGYGESSENASSPAPLPDTFRLEFKFDPAMSLTYDFSSSITQKLSVAGEEDLTYLMTLTGVTHQAVADVENDGRVGLIGLQGNAAWNVSSGAGNKVLASGSQTWCAAHRVSAGGESIPPRLNKRDRRSYMLLRFADPLFERSQLCAPFPAGEVGIGSQWHGPVMLPTMETTQPGVATSTVTKISRSRDGTVFCVIRSEVWSDGENSHRAWDLPPSGPKMEVRGVTEGAFDISRGIWLATRANLAAGIAGRQKASSFTGALIIRGAMRLKSAVSLPPEAVSAHALRTKAFDKALSRLFAGAYAEGIEALVKLEADETEPEWRKGLGTAVVLTRPILAYDSLGEKVRSAPPTTLPGEALSLFKAASEHTEAGELDKAVESLVRFLSSDDASIPGHMRLLAQYRLAGLYEKLGESAKAFQAFKAVAGMDANDDYSRQLRDKAAGKIDPPIETEDK